jgi:luciferase family oxidoreductase group 1
VLIGHVAEHTSTIRVGSGGIMLPNHTPLAIAEQFGTLDILYPGRIDLGLGRAPGTDQLTAAALRRNNLLSQNQFPEDIQNLQQFMRADNEDAKVRAFPGEGQEVPLWILGSSTDSAYLAAEMGLPYAFASHFAPAQLFAAIDIYKKNFKPSEALSKPYLMVAANVILADTNEEAAFLKTSLDMLFLGLITNKRGKLSPPVKELPELFSRADVQQAVYSMTACTFYGNMETLKPRLNKFLKETGADELIVTNYIYDREKRWRSFELLKETLGS